MTQPTKDGHHSVAAVSADIPADQAREVIDVAGKLVTPGLVDIHGHYLYRFFSAATDADKACLPYGVTTSMDAGSSCRMEAKVGVIASAGLRSLRVDIAKRLP